MPSERHQTGSLKKYYLLNAASLLPVLALELSDGETVLDLCAAPGGKSVALLQCASPGYLLCNEYDSRRVRWLGQTLESFIPQPLINVIKVSESDGREMGDAQPETFDKVLVDAPCSNDRSWLFSSDSQKAANRLQQRSNLPVLQVELLRLLCSRSNSKLIEEGMMRNRQLGRKEMRAPGKEQKQKNWKGILEAANVQVYHERDRPWMERSAVKALRPGGLLVYSTCTLSRAENQDVISEILTSNSTVVPVDISGLTRTCSQDFTFAPTNQKCSLLVIPEKGKAWGPMFIAKLKKIMSTGKW
ncbi:5-methylcytosine rRNA methyltransferase NSUN4 [Microtus ochrogaster]|uniref:5-methylcytosine rRNA methyltransferase NSUN4 n=2 Tax=Microtus ochrogaster TaxID=79684 RepID=A0A8J6FXM5_MICOH|nr:5-methylcytosine rRNA methyltransferase NSUN4 [Microtus ochrogaster]